MKEWCNGTSPSWNSGFLWGTSDFPGRWPNIRSDTDSLEETASGAHSSAADTTFDEYSDSDTNDVEQDQNKIYTLCFGYVDATDFFIYTRVEWLP